MRKALLFLITLAIILVSNPSLAYAQSTNPAVARDNMLQFFACLDNKSSNKVVTGQVPFFSDGQYTYEDGEAMFNSIGNQTGGRYPAMVATDYFNWRGSGGPRTDLFAPNKISKEYAVSGGKWGQGSGIVSISWHAPQPWKDNDSRDCTTSGSKRECNSMCGNTSCPSGSVPTRLNEILQPGPVRNTWLSSLDEVASGLQELENDGIVVLWRPFHEMNGNWFWWFDLPGSDGLENLWRDMHDYFTNVKGLDNLIWVFAPNTTSGERPYPIDSYPGSQYVDMVGIDKYIFGGSTMNLSSREWNETKGFGKPIILTEFGPYAPGGGGDGSYSYNSLIDDIQSKYPEIVGFKAWNAHWSLAESRNLNSFFDHPWIITKEELPTNWFDSNQIQAFCGGGTIPTTEPTNGGGCGPQGDIDCSGEVNIFDLSALLRNFGTSNPQGDIDNSGEVNVFDLSILLRNFGS